jgi:hypothetical protein
LVVGATSALVVGTATATLVGLGASFLVKNFSSACSAARETEGGEPRRPLSSADSAHSHSAGNATVPDVAWLHAALPFAPTSRPKLLKSGGVQSCPRRFCGITIRDGSYVCLKAIRLRDLHLTVVSGDPSRRKRATASRGPGAETKRPGHPWRPDHRPVRSSGETAAAAGSASSRTAAIVASRMRQLELT